MKIFDCIIFFNELDLLELRLKYLWDEIDYFVISEISKTHSGKDKKYYFEENKKRFEWAKEKIIHVKKEVNFDDLVFEKAKKYNPGDAFWIAEERHRETILLGLKKAEKKDIIILSDIDEIPKKEAIRKYKKSLYPRNATFEQKFHYYFFNCEVNPPNNFWNGSVICVKENVESIQKLRDERHIYEKIKEGGWHFSYLGGVDQIIKKLTSFSHSEYSHEQYTNKDKLLKLITEGKDILEREDMTFNFFDMQSKKDQYPKELVSPKKELLKYFFNEKIKASLKKNKFSVVIPTMWSANKYLMKMLELYIANPEIHEIIIIDNAPEKKPTDQKEKDLLENKKVVFYTEGKNIFVNPAWNKGAELAQAEKLMIANDDILISESDFNKLIKLVNENMEKESIFFLDRSCYNHENDNILGFESYPEQEAHPYGIGNLFFLHKKDYAPIPEELKIFFGEILQFYKNKPYSVKGIKMLGELAVTVSKMENYWEMYREEYKEWYKYIKTFKHYTQRPLYYSISKQLDKETGLNKPVLCFFIGYEQYHPNKKNLSEVEYLIKMISEELCDYFYVYIAGASINSLETMKVTFINSQELNDLANENKIDVMIVTNYLYYFLEFDINIANKTFFWLTSNMPLPYWDFKTLPHNGNPLFNNVAKLCEKIIVNSKEHRENLLLTNNIAEEKIVLLEKGVEYNFQKEKAQKIKNRFIWLDIYKKEDLADLINFFSSIRDELPDAELHIYNTTWPNDEDNNKKELADLIGQKKNIFYKGFVPLTNIGKEIAKADYWVFPSMNEQDNTLNILLAQKHRCLCITNKCVINKTHFENEQGIIINHEVEEEEFWIEALNVIKKMSKNKVLKNKYLDNAQAWANKNTWEHVSQKWFNEINRTKKRTSNKD